MFRSSIARVARPAFGVRGYADKTVSETVGDALKTAAKKFSADGGSVGSRFNPDGDLGHKGEEVGGTFSAKEDGAVGKAFSKDGVIGGTGQAVSDAAWDKGKELKGEPPQGSKK